MARHLVRVYLEGGHEIKMEASEIDVTLSEADATVVGYNIQSVPDERLSYLYLRPNAIVGIKAVLLEGDEEEPDSE